MELSDNIQFHAEETIVDNYSLVTVSGVKVSEIIGNFNAEEVLDTIDFAVIMEYVAQRRAEDKDE